MKFRWSMSLLNSVLDRTAVDFPSWIGWNSGGPKYRFRQQLSHLSDGASNSSKRLAICELRQSETRPVVESAFLADHSFLYNTGFLAKFCHDLPRNFVYKKRRQWTQLSAGYSNDSFRHTVWWLRICEVRLWWCTDCGQTDVGMEFWGLGAYDQWDSLGSKNRFGRTLSQISDAYSNTCFQ
jgi:hypothetical protein